MQPLLCFPDPFPAELALALERAGYPWKAVARPEHGVSDEPEDGWAGALVSADADPQGAFALCRSVRAPARCRCRPLLVIVAPGQVADLSLREDQFDDFCVLPVHPEELTARLAHLFWRTGRDCARS